jgi:hypothetical protein
MNESIQIKAREDDCIYIYNATSDKWQKLCDVDAPPKSVQETIVKMQRSSVK